MEILPQEVESLSRAAAKSLSENLGLEGKPLLISVLGSGWEKLPSACEIKSEILFSEIPGFAEPKAEGHEGKIVLAEAGGVDILFQLGRFHCYEGYSPLTVCFPIWAYAALGAKAILLLCAAGGLNQI
ncbi:MAG: purine-nucleoside phosphorylase, partial [Actinomycetota bacterium]|nr:purine-nucleoside phosphorylase [Actinomycetota bacterium]